MNTVTTTLCTYMCFGTVLKTNVKTPHHADGVIGWASCVDGPTGWASPSLPQAGLKAVGCQPRMREVEDHSPALWQTGRRNVDGWWFWMRDEEVVWLILITLALPSSSIFC